jgi:putative membrane protein
MSGKAPPPVLKSLLLLGLSAYFVHLWLGGDLHNYVNARFGWLPVLAAALFLVLGLHGMAAAARGGQRHHHAGQHGAVADHVHLPPSWAVLAIAAVPLLLGTLVPSEPLGARAVGGEASLDPGVLEGAVVPTSDSTDWTVLDWLRAYSAGGRQERINGKEADVIGFVYRREDDPKDAFVVMRFLMSCCSADAYAVGMPVVWANAETLPIDSWVRVRGTVNVGQFRGQSLPILTAAAVEENIARPKQAYLYQ